MIKQQIFPIETDFNWYDVNGLNEADSRRLQTEFYFTPEIISYVSDRHERPHYDYDQYTDTHLLVYDVPVWPTTTIKHFTSRPITFLLQDKNLFSFHTIETSYVFDEFNDPKVLRRLSHAQDVTELLVTFLMYASQYFQRAITQLDAERNDLDVKLSDDIDNKDLVELSNIEKSLVYLSSSIQTDQMMLRSLQHSRLTFSKAAKEMLDDVLIESSQSSEMVQNLNKHSTSKALRKYAKRLAIADSAGLSSIERAIYRAMHGLPAYDDLRKEAKGAGGVFSCELDNDIYDPVVFVNSLNLFSLAVSLGAVESLVELPSKMSHAELSEDEQLAAGIKPGLIRFAVGIEDAADLIADIDQALAEAKR